MAVAFADEFGSVPKSPNFAASLERAHLYAEEQGHRRITPEHMLLALSEDSDAGAILRALRVDVDIVRNEVAGLVGLDSDRFPLDQGGRPQISEELQRVLDAAAAAAGSKRRVLDGSLVLAALIGDGRSPAAEVLRRQGVTFEAVVKSLREQRPKANVRPVAAAPAGTPTPGQNQAGELREGPVDAVPRTRTRRPLPEPAPEDYEAAPPAPSASPPRPLPRAPRPETPSGMPPEMPWQREQQRGGPPYQRPPVEEGYGDPIDPGVDDDTVPYGMPAPGASARRRSPDAEGQRRPPPPQGVPAQAEPRPRQRPAKRAKRRQGVERGVLIENIPRVMRDAVSEIVEARIGRRDIEAMNDGMQGRGAPVSHEVFLTRAMSVRLRAPDGGFLIEPMSPETQWIENSLGIMDDDFASWRWSVMPMRRGRRRLQLVVSARSVGTNGDSAETALPEQVIDVRVRTNLGRLAGRAGLWLGAAVVTGIIGAFG